MHSWLLVTHYAKKNDDSMSTSMFDGTLTMYEDHLTIFDGPMTMFDGTFLMYDGHLTISDGPMTMFDGTLTIYDGVLTIP